MKSSASKRAVTFYDTSHLRSPITVQTKVF